MSICPGQVFFLRHDNLSRLKLHHILSRKSTLKYRIASNKRWASNKHRPLISVAPLGDSYYILLVAKLKYVWNLYANNKTMKILLVFRFFHYIWFIDSENFCFILILRENMTRF